MSKCTDYCVPDVDTKGHHKLAIKLDIPAPVKKETEKERLARNAALKKDQADRAFNAAHIEVLLSILREDYVWTLTKENVACNPYAAPGLLEKMIELECAEVRWQAASNVNIPPYLLARLIVDVDPKVRERARQAVVYRQKFKEVMCVVAEMVMYMQEELDRLSGKTKPTLQGDPSGESDIRVVGGIPLLPAESWGESPDSP